MNSRGNGTALLKRRVVTGTTATRPVEAFAGVGIAIAYGQALRSWERLSADTLIVADLMRHGQWAF